MDLLKPEVDAWLLRLYTRPTFANGLAITEQTKRLMAQNHRIQKESGRTLTETADWQGHAISNMPSASIPTALVLEQDLRGETDRPNYRCRNLCAAGRYGSPDRRADVPGFYSALHGNGRIVA